MFARLVLFFVCLSLSIVSLAKESKKRDPSSVDRPPQFVLLAFDGSKDNAFWQSSMAAADTIPTKEGSSKVRFTYFVNPTYYLAPANKKTYDTPRLGPGHSCIGFSSKAEDIPLRIANTNKAFLAGHEIGSHANAHCDQSGVDRSDPMFGKTWSEEDWTSEFTQFNSLLFDSLKINNLKSAEPSTYDNGFSFSTKNIVGFRAPKLAYTPGLWPTLKKFGFRYDTSMTSAPDYWPRKQPWGGWNFPLGEIKIAGTANRKILSMDYNWLVYQSAGESRPNLTSDQRQKMYDQVLSSYKYYFKKNYFGNRAPVHIGHHFSQWNKGVYWSVMQDFAKFVCNKPEVQCVTYSEYANWLDGLESSRYEAYRDGEFERMRDDNTIKDIATPILADIRMESDAEQFAAVVADKDRARVKVLGWKSQLQVNFENQPSSSMKRKKLLKKYKAGSTLVIRAVLTNRSGAEITWQTFKVKNFGTDKEVMQGPLEEMTLQGEPAGAHEDVYEDSEMSK